MASNLRAVVARSTGQKLRARVVDLAEGGMQLTVLDASSRSGAAELASWPGRGAPGATAAHRAGQGRGGEGRGGEGRGGAGRGGSDLGRVSRVRIGSKDGTSGVSSPSAAQPATPPDHGSPEARWQAEARQQAEAARIASPLPEYGEQVTVVVAMDGGAGAPGDRAEWAILSGTVRWFTGSGFGVAFRHLDEAQQSRIQRLLTQA